MNKLSTRGFASHEGTKLLIYFMGFGILGLAAIPFFSKEEPSNNASGNTATEVKNWPDNSAASKPVAANKTSVSEVPVINIDYSVFELLQTMEWHKDSVSCVAFTPDGKSLTSGSWGRVAFWDTSDWTRTRDFEPQYRLLQSIDFSRNGKLMLTAGSEGTIKIWNPDHLDEPLQVIDGYIYWPEGAVFSPDGTKVAICSLDVIDIVSVGTGKLIWQAEISENLAVNGVAFSPDGVLLASACAGDGNHVLIRDAGSGKLVRKLAGHENNVGSVAFSPDGKRIASAGADCTVRIWNAETYEALHVLKGHEKLVSDIAFSPDGRHLASSGYDHVIRIWSVKEGKEVCALAGHDERVRTVTFSPDGRLVASGGIDKTVRVWGVRE